MRPEDTLCPTPSGLYCRPGDFHIDPIRPVAAGADHARPFRPRPRRPRRGAGDARRRSASWRRATARILPGRRRRRDTRRDDRGSATPSVTFHPAGHVLGSAQIEVEAGGPTHRRLRRLQAPRRSDLPPLRAGALRHLHHRGDLRPAGLPPSAGRKPRSPSSSPRSRSSPSAPISSAPIRSARRSASSACCATPATTGRSTSTARWRSSAGSTRRKASASARSAPATVADRREGRLRRRGRHLPAVGDRRALGAALPRSGGRASPRAGCASASARSSRMSSCR